MEGMSYSLEMAEQIPNDSLAELALPLQELKKPGLPLEDAEMYQEMNTSLYGKVFFLETQEIHRTWKRNTKKAQLGLGGMVGPTSFRAFHSQQRRELGERNIDDPNMESLQYADPYASPYNTSRSLSHDPYGGGDYAPHPYDSGSQGYEHQSDYGSPHHSNYQEYPPSDSGQGGYGYTEPPPQSSDDFNGYGSDAPQRDSYREVDPWAVELEDPYGTRDRYDGAGDDEPYCAPSPIGPDPYSTLPKTEDPYQSSPGYRDYNHTPTPAGDGKWRAPDLQEVIDYLGHPNQSIVAHAAGYIQHLSYQNDDIKRKTREMGGIQPLVGLLGNPVPEIHRTACGSLRNLSYGKANEENKVKIKANGGIPALARLLRTSTDTETRDLAAGTLWNLSSSEPLKKTILEDALSVLVNNVLIPESGWEPSGNSPFKPADEPYTKTFINATGCLRNVSSGGLEARHRMRECEGLVDSLLHVLSSAMRNNDMDNQVVENTLCILRNLTFRIANEANHPDAVPLCSTSSDFPDSRAKSQQKKSLLEKEHTAPVRFSPNINCEQKTMYRCGPGRKLMEISRHDIFGSSGEGKHGRRIVVSGDSIAENTALSHSLAYDWATQNQASPLSKKLLVFELSANQFSRNQKIEAAIKQQCFREVDINEASIRQMLEDMPDKTAILVDGFDGNHIRDYGDNIMKVLTGRALPDVTVMVTAQPRSANLLLRFERGGKEEGKPERIEQTPSTCVVTAHHNEVSNTSSELFSSMHAQNDQPTTENEEKFERTILSTPLVDHPKSYEGNPFFTRTSLGSECKKTEKKRQSANNPCSSFRGQIQSLLHWIMAPAIILAGSPVFAAGEVSTEQVTIQVGQHAMIPFDIPNSPDNTSQVLSDFTLRFWSKPSPFYINGEIDIEGFKSPSQFPRFNISVAEMTSSICVKVNIDPVDLVDQDRYVLIASVQGSENVRSEVVTKNILVQIPPGPAKCFITLSENNNYPYEAHCQATTGSMITTLTCYQYGQRVKVKGDVTENGQVTRRVFLLPDNNPFSCCSHDVNHNVNEKMCDDFEWSPSRNSIGSPNVNGTRTPSVANTVDAFGNDEKESQADSATCKQCMTSTLSLTVGLMIYLFLCF